MVARVGACCGRTRVAGSVQRADDRARGGEDDAGPEQEHAKPPLAHASGEHVSQAVAKLLVARGHVTLDRLDRRIELSIDGLPQAEKPFATAAFVRWRSSITPRSCEDAV
jgi:hypothetical protein